MSENISKPMLVVRGEFINEVVNLINNSGLPLVIVEPILNDVHNSVQAAIARQYETEKHQYEEELKKNTKVQTQEGD